MDIKTFFALNEASLNEMAGMPQDNPYNGFMYLKIMEKYGTKYQPGSVSPWPAKTPGQQKLDDVAQWHSEADAQGIYPSKEVSARSVVAGLEWPFSVGSGLKSKNAARNMRDLAVKVGFATKEQMDDLYRREEAKAGKAAAPAAQAPKMSTVLKTSPGQKLGGAPKPPDDDLGGGI